MSNIKQLIAMRRAMKALLFPAAWLQWVNSERCYVEIHNDPSGQWTLKIGNLAQPWVTSRSLRRACWTMFWLLESNPDWTWTTDWLKKLPR